MKRTNVTMGCVLAALLSPSLANAEESTNAHSQEPADQGHTGTRDVSVSSTPAGARMILDAQRPVREAPDTFQLSQEEHDLLVEAPGYEWISVPIPAGSNDLVIDVELSPSRSVSRSSIAVTIFGGVFVLTGIVLAAIFASEIGEFFEMGPALAVPFLGVGVPMTVGGIVEMVRNRCRDSMYTISNR